MSVLTKEEIDAVLCSFHLPVEEPFAATSEVTDKDINPFKDEDTEG